MNLVQTKTELFQGEPLDVYQDEYRQAFMTIEQLANALGYASKKGIENIIERNKYLREKEFSIISKVPLNVGGTQSTRLFTLDGVMEIGYLSHKPKAKAFRAFSRQVVKAYLQGELIFKEKRTTGKAIRKSMTDAIKEKGLSQHYYKHYSELAYKTALGMTSRQLKQKFGDDILDHLSAEELEKLNETQNKIAVLIQLDMNYKDIKDLIK